jgi:pyruvate dehydrogenase E2 component (dihydrolipoamide acetyltransferase)
MELVARGDGVLRKRLANEGDSAPVGTLLAVVAAPDENIDAVIGSAPAAKEPAQVVAQAKETAGASPVPNTAAQSQGEASTPPQAKVPGGNGAQATAPAAPPATPTTSGRPRSSPLARRIASERGLELSAIQGSGPGGRIVKRDIESAAAAPRGAPHPVRERGAEEFVDVPLTQIRKTIARRLVESIGPVPTFYLTAEFDMGKAAEMRAALTEIGDEYKASFNDIVIRAVALSLAEHPEVNAHWLGDKIRQFNRVHIGMAVAIEEGLITPVIFDADQKSLHDISREARDLAGRARERKLTPEQYTGSTFSVSNLGMFGIDQFTAIINPPEAGILAVGAVESKAIVSNGSVEVRQRMRVTMSCDHRVVDGATGAKFLQTVRRYIEHPLLLVI